MDVNDVSRQPAGDLTATFVGLMGDPTSSAWREDALARAAEMSTLLLWLEKESELENTGPLVMAVQVHLQAAEKSAHEEHKWVLRTMSGAIIERTLANLHAAYINLLRLAPLDYLQSNVPNLLVQAREQLGSDDPRLRQLEILAKEANRRKLEHPERNAIVAAIQGAGEHWRRAQMRVRNFRNVIVFTAVMIMLLAVTVGIVGFFRPTALPLCFQPEPQLVVCPTAQAVVPDGQPGGQQPPSPAAVDDAIRRAASRWDIALVEFIGLLGATVAATVALRQSRGTTDPYSLPAALAMLKVCTGALTAFLGLVLVRAAFIPGLSALDSSAQIIAWAVVLGYAQQLFTRAVDQQAQNVISEAQEPTAPPPPPPAPEEVSSQLQPTAPLSQARGGWRQTPPAPEEASSQLQPTAPLNQAEGGWRQNLAGLIGGRSGRPPRAADTSSSQLDTGGGER